MEDQQNWNVVSSRVILSVRDTVEMEMNEKIIPSNLDPGIVSFLNEKS